MAFQGMKLFWRNTIHKNRIKGIIFDLDGTLIDSYAPIMESLNHTRKSFNLAPFTLEEVRKIVGRGLEVLIAETIGDAHVKEGIRIFREKYGSVFLEKTKLMPNVKEVIPSLARKGYLMAVTSNKPSYFTSEILKSRGIYEYFKVILGPDDSPKAKPDPGMVEMAIKEMRLRKDEVVYVGDMTIDIETSRRAGIKVVGITSGSNSKEELERASPDALIENLEELEDLFPFLYQAG
ncbi:MAG: HAD-IA family hydrolase [Acidobacteriota bacterium]